jgi:PKD repeat protein
MKNKNFIICFVVLLFLLVTILLGKVCVAETNIKIAVAKSDTGTYHVNVTEALDDFSWCVGNEIYTFDTNLCYFENSTILWSWFYDEEEGKYCTLDPLKYHVYIADGVPHELEKCAREGAYPGGKDKIKTILNEYVEEGGGYIGRCGGSVEPPSFNYDIRKPNTIYEYRLGHLSSWLGENAPEVKLQLKVDAYPWYSQFFTFQTWWKTGPYPWPKFREPNDDPEAAGALGQQAYRRWYSNGDFVGVCHNIILEDKDHAILKNYWGDTIFTNSQVGGFSNPPQNSGVSVLARFPNTWEGDETYRLDKWEYRTEEGGEWEFLKILLNYRLENFFNFKLGKSVKDFLDDNRWHRLVGDQMDTDTANNPAIIAFEYNNNGGRVVLSGPHVASPVWDENAKLINQPYTHGEATNWKTLKNHDLPGFYYWALIDPVTQEETPIYDPDNPKGHYKPNKDTYWYQRREAAWVSNMVPDEKLPPAHGRSHVVDIDPSFQDSTTVNIICCVARQNNESNSWDFDNESSHNLTLYYKYFDIDHWTPWYEYTDEYKLKRPYTFTFDTSSKNGSGEYKFYSRLYAPNESGPDSENWYYDCIPEDYNELAYDAKVEVGGNVSSKISIEGTYFYTMNSINFNGTGSLTKNGTTITNYTWDFGDGNQSYVSSPTHTYYDDGTYNVTLNVTNNQSYSNVTKKTIKIHNNPPTIDFIHIIPPIANKLNTIMNFKTLDIFFNFLFEGKKISFFQLRNNYLTLFYSFYPFF